MSWAKSDGAKIKITFDRPLIGTITGNQAAFTVTVPEYDYVPGGTIHDVVKAVKSTDAYNGVQESIVLEMEPLQRFESAAGDIIVAYDGSGTLQGEGGAVEAFTHTFTPADLAYKGDQNDAEHIEISNITTTAVLTAINYKNAQIGNEYIQISSITVTGALTHVKDI